MSITSIELWQRVVAEGIASPMQCRSWAAEVAKILPAADTADGLKVLQQLIDLGKLTKYQAKCLAGQSSDPLKRGPWNILGKVKVSQFQGWLEVTKIDTSKGEQPPSRWMRWLKAGDLDNLRASAPSLPRGIQLAQIRHQHLQVVEMPEMVEGELQLQVAPVVGTSLSTTFSETRPTSEQTQSIIDQVSLALAAMHQRQVVHGRVMPDRIFWEPNLGATLICDPISVWTASVEQSAGGILGEQMNGLQVASFLAPEFLAPRQPPSMASDIYALGATWWWLLTGKSIAEGKNVASTLAQAADVKLDFRDQSIQLPEPIKICLQFCLAKNPAARLASAVQLVDALNAAKRSVAKGKVHKLVEPEVDQLAKPIPLTSAERSQQAQETKPVGAVTPSATEATKSVGAKAAKPIEAETTKPIEVIAAKPVEVIIAKSVETARPKSTAEDRSATAAATTTPTAGATAALPQSTKPAAVSQSTEAKADAPTSTESSARRSRSDQPPSTKKTAGSSTVASKTAESVAESKKADPTTADSASQPNLIASESSPELTTAVATVAASSHKPATISKPIARRKAKRKSKLPLMITAGFAFLALILGILKLSGALEGSGKMEVAENKGTFQPSVNASQPTIIEKDPILDHFRLVDSKDAAWAPPHAPSPIDIDMLPPGAQLYLALRPADLVAGKSSALIATLNKQFGFDQLLTQLARPTGQTVDSIKTITVAFYTAPAPEQLPQFAARVELTIGLSLDQLKSSWGYSSDAVVGQERLLVGQHDTAYYVPNDADPAKVDRFSFGPSALMKEVAELSGGAAALNTQFKQFHARTCKQYQLVILGSPRYLFGEGRGLVKAIPQRFQEQIEPIFGKESRAIVLQTNIADQWYWELQLAGPTDAESPRLMNRLNESASSAATQIEQWLFDQTPHPYWRALALRFPQMIRTWREFARFSLEDGAAIANGYLPANAANNLIVTCWIASQDSATFSGQLAANTPATNTTPATTMTPEDLLNKPIRLIFDQEPIEKALALVGEEANSGIAANDQIRFELDGGAFERAGITRNQQLRDYKIDNRPVRDGLTEIAKRGNPVTTVKDTRETDQRLIWVVRDDPKNPGKKMISLTTREAAAAANIQLPREFAQ